MLKDWGLPLHEKNPWETHGGLHAVFFTDSLGTNLLGDID